MVKVLRVENEAGIGMYSVPYSFDSPPSFPYETNRKETHPSPGDDEGLNPRWRNLKNVRLWFFGFYDHRQLDEWIHKEKWKSELSDLGCAISTYEVDEEFFIRGHKQCVFMKSKAKRIDRKGFS
jgi:hypothetical protein